MKIVLKIISVIIFLLIISFGIMCLSSNSEVSTSLININLSTGIIIIFSFCIGLITAVLFYIGNTMSTSVDKTKLKRQAENAKLNFEIESDKVKQLEAKIKTLEEALKTITSKK